MFCSAPPCYDKKNPKLDNDTVLWQALKKDLFSSHSDDTEILCEVHFTMEVTHTSSLLTMYSPDQQTMPQNPAYCQRLWQMPQE